jgi:hypothetical protein
VISNATFLLSFQGAGTNTALLRFLAGALAQPFLRFLCARPIHWGRCLENAEQSGLGAVVYASSSGSLLTASPTAASPESTIGLQKVSRSLMCGSKEIDVL